MGVKGSKAHAKLEELRESKRHGQGLSKEDLASCLATLSDMAHTGVDTALPEIRINDRPPAPAQPPDPEMLRSFRRKVKERLQRQVSTNDEEAFSEHVDKQLELLDSLEKQDDNSDWASMRNWIVLCMHQNLKDDLPEDDLDLMAYSDLAAARPQRNMSAMGRRNTLTRQKALDTSRIRQTPQNSLSFESDGSRVSCQNSFDSCGAGGDT